MQFSGSFLQSTLQRKRCQVMKPIGGVNDRPLFSAWKIGIAKNALKTRIYNFSISEFLSVVLEKKFLIRKEKLRLKINLNKIKNLK